MVRKIMELTEAKWLLDDNGHYYTVVVESESSDAGGRWITTKTGHKVFLYDDIADKSIPPGIRPIKSKTEAREQAFKLYIEKRNWAGKSDKWINLNRKVGAAEGRISAFSHTAYKLAGIQRKAALLYVAKLRTLSSRLATRRDKV